MGTPYSSIVTHGNSKEFALARLLTRTGAQNYVFVPHEARVITYTPCNDLQDTWFTNVLLTDEYDIQYRAHVEYRKYHPSAPYMAFYRTMMEV